MEEQRFDAMVKDSCDASGLSRDQLCAAVCRMGMRGSANGADMREFTDSQLSWLGVFAAQHAIEMLGSERG